MQLYDLNNSQEVVLLQCKYTVHKRVVNILSSFEKDDLDFETAEKALEAVIRRNDCLRLRFIKKQGKLRQYFLESEGRRTIPRLTFYSRKQLDEWIAEVRKTPVKYLKDETFSVWFITVAGKKMIFFKFCHLIVDIAGITNVYLDLNACYEAIRRGEDLPKEPPRFEEVLQSDLAAKADAEKARKDRDFLCGFFGTHEEPLYASLGGDKDAVFAKRKAKGQRWQKMSLLANDTCGTMYLIDKEHSDLVMQFAENNKMTPATVLMYLMSVTASYINGKAEHLLPLELCNCRATVKEKKTGGTKAQSLAAYTSVDYALSLKDNLTAYNAERNEHIRHVGFSDVEFQKILHKIYHCPFLGTYYNFSFSFIPVKMPQDMKIGFYSNGKCALLCYCDAMYDTDKGDIRLIYDYQTASLREEMISDFHRKLLQTIEFLRDADRPLEKLTLL